MVSRIIVEDLEEVLLTPPEYRGKHDVVTINGIQLEGEGKVHVRIFIRVRQRNFTERLHVPGSQQQVLKCTGRLRSTFKFYLFPSQILWLSHLPSCLLSFKKTGTRILFRIDLHFETCSL